MGRGSPERVRPLEGGADQIRGALDGGWGRGEARGYQILESEVSHPRGGIAEDLSQRSLLHQLLRLWPGYACRPM